MDNWIHGYECATPSQGNLQVPPLLPRDGDKELVDVYNAEDDFASTSGLEKNDDLFNNAYDDEY